MVKEQTTLVKNEYAKSSNLDAETENLGRIYKIHGNTKEKNVRKELIDRVTNY